MEEKDDHESGAESDAFAESEEESKNGSQSATPLTKKRGRPKANGSASATKKAKMKKEVATNVDTIINNIRSQQVEMKDKKEIMDYCKNELSNFNKDEHYLFLEASRKVKDEISTIEKTEAMKVMSSATGDEKTFYDSAKDMSFADIDKLYTETQLEEEKVEEQLHNLQNRNYVLNYLMKSKNSIKKARVILTNCILQVLADDNDDDNDE